jgi:hypothetical protein
MEALDHLMTVICVIAIVLTWYFGLGVRRSSRALQVQLERASPWDTSSSDEQTRRLGEMELRRARRSRAIYAAICAGIVVLSTFLKYAIQEGMYEAGTRARPRLSPDLTTERAMILVFLSGVLVAAAGLFLFFAGRFLFLTAIAQRHRITERRLIVRDAFRLSSYDEQGRNDLRRAGTAGLLSLASLVAFFLVAVTLQSCQ